MKSQILKPIFLAILSIVLVGCQNTKKQSPKDSQLKVVSSFSILSEMVKEIGKDSVIVHNLVPIGVDPHQYEMNPEDIKFATTADLFLYNGLNLEGGDNGWFAKMVSALNIDNKKVFEASQGISPKYLTEHKGRKEVNPHAFIDPSNGIIMAKNIRNTLIDNDPKRQDYYKKNADAYIKKLVKIEQDYRHQFGKIPKKDKVFIASEEAFQYLVDRYGFKEGYIWAIDTEENGSPEQIKAAINFVKKYQPKVLFVESNVDIRPMQTVSKATNTPIYSPAIFSDELGKPGQEADSYIKYLKYNLKHIYKGLTEGE